MGDTEVPLSLQTSLDNTKVTYAQLGASGLLVSIPILGAMSFGHKDWQPWVVDSQEEINTLLKGAYDRGLNTWDTANVYSNGVSEIMIGNAIKKFNIPRHKLVILTKCFRIVGEEPGVSHIRFPQMDKSKDYVNQGGLSRIAIFNAVNASLARLQTDYIDLFQIHRFDPTVPVEETMKALHDLVQSGKVRYIGASSMWAYQFAKLQSCAEAHNWTKFISMQNHYSLCYREEEREMNKYCHSTGVGLIAWGPLYFGHLARPPPPSSTKKEEAELTDRERAMNTNALLAGPDVEIIKRVQELAAKKERKMSQVALAWVVQKKSLPIVGFNSLARLEEACAVKGVVLSAEESAYLEELYLPKPIFGHS